MTVYLVFRRGSVRGTCGGVFQSLEMARNAAACLADDDRTPGISYDVTYMEMNSIAVFDSMGWLAEQPTMYSFTKLCSGKIVELCSGEAVEE